MTRHGLTLWDRVAEPDDNGCRLWTGPVNVHGYGRIRLAQGRLEYVHRLAVGPIPLRWEVDHTCHNRRCCNPEHLDTVPKVEHQRRYRLVQVCPQGHSDYRTAKRGTRYCFPCQQESARRTAARRKSGEPGPGQGLPGVKRATREARYRPSDPDPQHGCPGHL